jgi:hypothetical protein
MPTLKFLSCLLLLTLGSLSACGFTPNQRLVYGEQSVRIGIEADPTVARSGGADLNKHPANLTTKEVESLLKVIEVSGWSGTILGMLEVPRPVPLITPKELSLISGHLATAFREAQPTERVFFSLPKPEVTYSDDRTEGFLFLRGRYFHVVVTDHSSLIQTDTGGGNLKDVRDTKSMKLWVKGPAQAAMVPDLEEPRWAPFETVHVSLNVKEVLAQQEAPGSSPKGRQVGVSTEELQLQIRELNSSNQELRSRLEEQNKRMQELNGQLEQLRQELTKTKPKTRPSRSAPAQ